MKSPLTRTALAVGSVLAMVAGAFVLLQSRYRSAETMVTLWSLRPLIAHHIERFTFDTMLVRPFSHEPFHVIVTPSCSAFAALCAFACLWPLTRGFSVGRRIFAFTVAGALVAVGNIMRIDLSILVGIFAGRSSLVLFHDWVGSAFSFAYTLLGFVLMLRFLLPREAPQVALRARVSYAT